MGKNNVKYIEWLNLVKELFMRGRLQRLTMARPSYIIAIIFIITIIIIDIIIIAIIIIIIVIIVR